MIALFNDPHGEKVVRKIKSQPPITSTKTSIVSESTMNVLDDEEISALNKMLENRLKQHRTSIFKV